MSSQHSITRASSVGDTRAAVRRAARPNHPLQQIPAVSVVSAPKLLGCRGLPSGGVRRQVESVTGAFCTFNSSTTVTVATSGAAASLSSRSRSAAFAINLPVRYGKSLQSQATFGPTRFVILRPNGGKEAGFGLWHQNRPSMLLQS